MGPGRLIRVPATWYGYFLVGIQLYLFNVQGNVIPFLQSEFQISYGIVGLHSIAIAAGVIAMGLVADRVTRKLGRRLTLAIGGSGLGIGAAFLCISPAPAASIASCLVMGLAGGIIPSVVPAVLADLHGERRNQAYAEQAIIGYTLAVLGPLSAGLFVWLGLGWRYAVMLGAIVALLLVAIFRNAALPPQRPKPEGRAGKLSAAFWAYWAVIATACALEFSVLLWGPAFLERVIGFSPAAAATGAAAFFAGVLLTRIFLRLVVSFVSPRTILFSAFAAGALGFALYWGVNDQTAAIAGIFLLGVCVAPQYPVVMSLAIGAAGSASDLGAARLTLAFGIAILIAPALLGALADLFGLWAAHLTLPALIGAGCLALVAAGILERREVTPPA